MTHRQFYNDSSFEEMVMRTFVLLLFALAFAIPALAKTSDCTRFNDSDGTRQVQVSWGHNRSLTITESYCESCPKVSLYTGRVSCENRPLGQDCMQNDGTVVMRSVRTIIKRKSVNLIDLNPTVVDNADLLVCPIRK